MNSLDRPLDDIVKENRQSRPARGPKRAPHAHANSVRSAPYEVQRRASANTTAPVPRGNSSGAWTHDLFPSLNGKTNSKGGKGKEEIIQFPPKKLTPKEEAQLLQKNPLFQRMNATPTGPSFNPPKAPAALTKAPVALTKSASTPIRSTLTPPISIAGTATASIIISNLAPTVSVEDVKATLAGIGGGVRAVQIMTHGKSGQGLQAKVTFTKPAEGGRECIARFNGVVADGRKISVAFETPAVQPQRTSFLNHEPAPSGPRAQRNRPRKAPGQGNAPTARIATPDGQLYSDAMVTKGGRTNR